MRKGAPRVGAIMMWLAIVLAPPLLLAGFVLAFAGYGREVGYGLAAVALTEVAAVALAWLRVS
jgi:hypothetical protein